VTNVITPNTKCAGGCGAIARSGHARRWHFFMSVSDALANAWGCDTTDRGGWFARRGDVESLRVQDLRASAGFWE